MAAYTYSCFITAGGVRIWPPQDTENPSSSPATPPQDMDERTQDVALSLLPFNFRRPPFYFPSSSFELSEPPQNSNVGQYTNPKIPAAAAAASEPARYPRTKVNQSFEQLRQEEITLDDFKIILSEAFKEGGEFQLQKQQSQRRVQIQASQNLLLRDILAYFADKVDLETIQWIISRGGTHHNKWGHPSKEKWLSNTIIYPAISAALKKKGEGEEAQVLRQNQQKIARCLLNQTKTQNFASEKFCEIISLSIEMDFLDPVQMLLSCERSEFCQKAGNNNLNRWIDLILDSSKAPKAFLLLLLENHTSVKLSLEVFKRITLFCLTKNSIKLLEHISANSSCLSDCNQGEIISFLNQTSTTAQQQEKFDVSRRLNILSTSLTPQLEVEPPPKRRA